MFQKQFALAELVSATGGRAGDSASLSQRMLLLMEARCVYDEVFGTEVIGALLDLYFQYHAAEPAKEAVFLLNDVIRYFRHICVNYQHTFTHDHDRWALRNVKLRHSRVVMYAGLLMLILEASAKTHADRKRNFINDELQYPPLARISRVLDRLGEQRASTDVLARYDLFLGTIADADKRRELQLEYDERLAHPRYVELKANSDALARVLADAIYRQRGAGRWSDEVFDYLIL